MGTAFVGTLFMTMIGELSDGAIALIDLSITSNKMSLPGKPGRA